MARYIDIELTSHAPDGTWTWRAAGAKQPKGAVEPALVPTGAAVGDVLRAEVVSALDGMEVAALAVRRDAPVADNRIEVLGTPRPSPDVSVSLAPGRRRRDGDQRRGRGGRDSGDQQRDGGDRRGSDRRPGPKGAGGRQEGRGTGGPRSRDGRGDARSGTSLRRDRRPALSTVHRNAALAALRPEQLPVGEQLLRGGIPAVRQAIDEQNAAARAAGRPPVVAESLLKIAEELLPGIRLAEWKDRAVAVQTAGRDARLRELRTVVAASRTVTLDDEGREVARSLQEALEQRVTALRQEWLDRVGRALDEGRVLDALQVVAQPPEPGARCPAELATRLAGAASAAMTADVPSLEWQGLLRAVVDAPVRRTVKPEGIPDDDAARAAARNAAGMVPALAKLLGLRIPPPPPPRRSTPRRALSPTGDGGRAAGP